MDRPEFETVRVEIEGDTLVAVLCRPQQRNAVGTQLLLDLIALADWLRQREDIHFVVLDHEGPVFSSGAHLGEMMKVLNQPDTMRAQLRRYQRLAQEMFAKISGVEQITFAAVRNSAYGAGVGVALPFDFRVMADDAVFNLPEASLGMFLAWGLTPRLVAAAGLSRAKEMIMFAQDWSAQQCFGVGMVDRVVTKEDVRPTIDQMIATLRNRSWNAIRMTKQMANAAAAAARMGDLAVPEVELVGETLAGGEVAQKLGEFLASKHKKS